jgi:hypothetical protein
LDIGATKVDFEVAATVRNQAPEPFAGTAEASVIFDPQEVMQIASYLPYVGDG